MRDRVQLGTARHRSVRSVVDILTHGPFRLIRSFDPLYTGKPERIYVFHCSVTGLEVLKLLCVGQHKNLSQIKFHFYFGI